MLQQQSTLLIQHCTWTADLLIHSIKIGCKSQKEQLGCKATRTTTTQLHYIKSAWACHFVAETVAVPYQFEWKLHHFNMTNACKHSLSKSQKPFLKKDIFEFGVCWIPFASTAHKAHPWFYHNANTTRNQWRSMFIALIQVAFSQKLLNQTSNFVYPLNRPSFERFHSFCSHCDNHCLFQCCIINWRIFGQTLTRMRTTVLFYWKWNVAYAYAISSHHLMIQIYQTRSD